MKRQNRSRALCSTNEHEQDEQSVIMGEKRLKQAFFSFKKIKENLFVYMLTLYIQKTII